MIKLGITGGIGSGKSTVTELFRLLGIPVYIADTESKKLVSTSPIIREKLIEAFGQELFDGDVLNKALLASYIFSDKQKLNITNAIIHPEVKKDFEEWMNANKHKPIVAHEAAILFESGFDKIMDKIILVYTPLDLRLRRTMLRDNTTKEKVLERMQNQMPDEDKAKLVDFIIVNDDKVSLIKQTLSFLNQLKNLE